MNARQLWFVSPGKVEVREQALDDLLPGQILVENQFSAISAGTELLVYRGQLPDSLSVDKNLQAYAGQTAGYPLQYGYACVGTIIEVGKHVDSAIKGRMVFSFQPHASHFCCSAEATIFVPDGINPKAAVFLANMETAVNLVHDGNPLLGERVVVIGQGVVGHLVTRLLSEFPLAELSVLDSLESRRNLAIEGGAYSAYSPVSESDLTVLRDRLDDESTQGGADLLFELSGNPEALNLAIDLCGFSGRVVVGSWYGTKRSEINLGERFHRDRIRIISSQVSTIDPQLTGRWDKARRFQLVWDKIKSLQPEQLVSHCLPFEAAPQAYASLDSNSEDMLQVVFDYKSQQ